MIALLWIPFGIGLMRRNIDFVAFSPLFGALPWIGLSSFGKRGHLRARVDISTGVLTHFAERRADLSKMIEELGVFLSDKISSGRSFFVAYHVFLLERLSAFRNAWRCTHQYCTIATASGSAGDRWYPVL